MSVASLDYATPARPNRRFIDRVPAPIFLFWTAIALLGIDVCVLALPAFGPFYIGSPMLIATRWAQVALMFATWISSIFAVTTIAASFYFPHNCWPLRLARSIALALVVYQWVFAPGKGTYVRLCWGSC